MTEQTYTVEDFRAAASLTPNEIPIGVIYKAIHIAELVMTPGVIQAGLPSGWWDLSAYGVESVIRDALTGNS